MFLSQWLRYIHENYTNWNSKQKVFFVCHWKKITFQRHRANQSQDIERIVETCFEDLLGHPNPTIKSKQSRNNDALNHNGLQFLLLFFMNKFLLFVRFYVQTSLRILDLQLNYGWYGSETFNCVARLPKIPNIHTFDVRILCTPRKKFFARRQA